MQVTIDGLRCIACGLCERMAPALFRVVAHRVAVVVPAVRAIVPTAAPAADLTFEVAMACPTEAIQIEHKEESPWR